MLRVNRLVLNDFGPYKGTQEISFPKDDGVVVIFGENGRGKTFLLNAIRFAFFDRILGRGLREIDHARILNWESKLEGKKQFSVDLEFTFGEGTYELTRVCDLDNSGKSKSETFLRKDGVDFSPENTRKTLAKIMPEQVSRFFLFEGELLQEYEDLVLEDSNQNHGIKEAIEKILGVPILSNSIAHISDLYK